MTIVRRSGVTNAAPSGIARGTSSLPTAPATGIGHGSSSLGSVVTSTGRVNFTVTVAVDALKDVLKTLRVTKAEALKRLQDVEAVKMATLIRMAESSAAASANAGTWTPFGRLVLPLINSPAGPDRQNECTLVLAVCAATDREIRRELATTQQVIVQVQDSIQSLSTT